MASVVRATVAIGIFSHGDHFYGFLSLQLQYATVANRRMVALRPSSDSSAALAALLIENEVLAPLLLIARQL